MVQSVFSAGTQSYGTKGGTITNPSSGTTSIISEIIGSLAFRTRNLQFQSSLNQPAEIQLLAQQNNAAPFQPVPFLDMIIPAGNVTNQDVILTPSGFILGANLAVNELILPETGSLRLLSEAYYIFIVNLILASSATGSLLWGYGFRA